MKCDILCSNINYHGVVSDLHPRLEEISFSSIYLFEMHAMLLKTYYILFLCSFTISNILENYGGMLITISAVYFYWLGINYRASWFSALVLT